MRAFYLISVIAASVFLILALVLEESEDSRTSALLCGVVIGHAGVTFLLKRQAP
jgi:hypothetical protein